MVKKKDIATMVSENGKIYYSKGGKQEGIFRLITTNNEENIDKFHKKKSVLIKKYLSNGINFRNETLNISTKSHLMLFVYLKTSV